MTSQGSKSSLVVHDFAYADIAFDGHEPPSILQVEGRKDCCVELYTLTKSFSMAGWRVGFMLGNARRRRGTRAAEVIPRLRHVPADPDRGDGHDERAPDYPVEVCRIYESARRTVRRAGADGWEFPKPRGTMFVWAPIPEPYRELGSLGSPSMLAREAHVAVSPGIGFGAGGDGFVRFALVENEQRIRPGGALRRLSPVLLSLADVEAGEPLRLLGDDVDPVDARAPRAVAHEADEPVDRLTLALEDRLDAAVREVPHPAGDTVGERAASGRLAEEDALDVTLHGDAAALHGF